METSKLLMIGGLILFLFLFLRIVRIDIKDTPITSTTKVVYRRPVSAPNPHYNAYKAQYYN
jgi:hypothetical protein